LDNDCTPSNVGTRGYPICAVIISVLLIGLYFPGDLFHLLWWSNLLPLGHDRSWYNLHCAEGGGPVDPWGCLPRKKEGVEGVGQLPGNLLTKRS